MGIKTKFSLMKHSTNDFVVLQHDNIVEFILKSNIMSNVKNINKSLLKNMINTCTCIYHKYITNVSQIVA